MMAQRVNITDRARRYRAQRNVTGPKRCVLCGKRGRLDVMHLDGNESHGEKENLAYGCRSCNGKLAAAFKRIGAGKLTRQYNPASGYPTFQQYAWAVSSGARDYYPNSTRHASGVKDEAGAIIHATPKHLRIEYAQRIASAKRRKAQSNPWPFSKQAEAPKHRARRSGMTVAAAMSAAKEAGYRGLDYTDWLERKGLADRGSQVVSRLGQAYRDGMDKRESDDRRKQDARDAARDKVSVRKAKAAEASELRSLKEVDAEALKEHIAKGGTLAEFLRSNPAKLKRGCRANPGSAAAEAYEEFHGHPSGEEVRVKQRVHRHTHLAAAGDLAGLHVKPIKRTLPVRTIRGLGDAILAFNEQKSQLFVRGGDQSMSTTELKRFGITQVHELETIGRLTGIEYDTEKDHLGDEGGRAIYSHTFRMTNENGRHVVVKIARYPDLIYRVLDEQFEFSGGSYTIRAEGIDK